MFGKHAAADHVLGCRGVRGAFCAVAERWEWDVEAAFGFGPAASLCSAAC
jgi:hypothetical protein